MRVAVLSVMCLLCSSLFAQSADKDLTFHVTKKADLKQLYGMWRCTYSAYEKIDTPWRNEWSFTKDGRFNDALYLNGINDIEIAGTFRRASDTLYLNIDNGGMRDTILLSNLTDKEMKWRRLSRKSGKAEFVKIEP